MKHLKLKTLLTERFNFQDVVDDVVEIAAKYSKSKEIWDERDVEHKDIDALIDSIKRTNFIPRNKWNAFIKEVQKNMPRYTPNFKRK